MRNRVKEGARRFVKWLVGFVPEPEIIFMWIVLLFVAMVCVGAVLYGGVD